MGPSRVGAASAWSRETPIPTQTTWRLLSPHELPPAAPHKQSANSLFPLLTWPRVLAAYELAQSSNFWTAVAAGVVGAFIMALFTEVRIRWRAIAAVLMVAVVVGSVAYGSKISDVCPSLKWPDLSAVGLEALVAGVVVAVLMVSYAVFRERFRRQS